MAKIIIGILLIILGIALGIYVGVWLMLIGGIVGLIEAIKTLVQTGDINAMLIAVSIVKILFSGMASLITILFCTIGQTILESQ